MSHHQHTDEATAQAEDQAQYDSLSDGERAMMAAVYCRAGACDHDECHDYRDRLHTELFPQCRGLEDDHDAHDHDDADLVDEAQSRTWAEAMRLGKDGTDRDGVLTMGLVRGKLGRVTFTPARKPKVIPAPDPSVPF